MAAEAKQPRTLPRLDAADGAGDTPLLLAASRGADAIVRELLRAGASANLARASDKRTPLMQAAAGGHLACVETLLRHGAHPFAADAAGATALSLATTRECRNALSRAEGRLVVLHALLASQPRLGEHSALRRSLTSSALYDKNVWRDVFRFL